jgi:PleD family two-component response regulator
MISDSNILNAKILIIDDHYANVTLLERILHHAGYTTVSSTIDPYAVCKLHRANHYDLILLDINMSGIDGFQILNELKEIETDSYLPVIVITADPNYKLRALAEGAIDFIAKPFDIGEAQARIYNMLKVRLMYNELKNLRKANE